MLVVAVQPLVRRGLEEALGALAVVQEVTAKQLMLSRWRQLLSCWTYMLGWNGRLIELLRSCTMGKSLQHFDAFELMILFLVMKRVHENSPPYNARS